jgi:hypothetical protein
MKRAQCPHEQDPQQNYTFCLLALVHSEGRVSFLPSINYYSEVWTSEASTYRSVQRTWSLPKPKHVFVFFLGIMRRAIDFPSTWHMHSFTTWSHCDPVSVPSAFQSRSCRASKSSQLSPPRIYYSSVHRVHVPLLPLICFLWSQEPWTRRVTSRCTSMAITRFFSTR